MLDEKRLNFIIEDINIYLKKLENFKITKENLKSDEKFLASSMAIFQVLNKSIDLGEEIVTSENIGYPLKLRDIFDFLEDKKIIDEKLAEKMKEFVLMRNKFSHRYEKLDEKDILKFAEEDKRYVVKFIEEITKHLKAKFHTK